MNVRVKAKVEQCDIDGGKPQSASACAIAAGLKRQVVEWFGSIGSRGAKVRVEGDSVAIELGTGEMWYAELSRAAQRFVQKFDSKNGKELVKPFNFTMTLSNN